MERQNIMLTWATGQQRRRVTTLNNGEGEEESGDIEASHRLCGVSETAGIDPEGQFRYFEH